MLSPRALILTVTDNTGLMRLNKSSTDERTALDESIFKIKLLAMINLFYV
jgi:hypothetical protein